MKIIKRAVILVIIFGIAAALYVLFSNLYIINAQKNRIFNYTDIENISLKDADCIIVLGAGVRPDGTPSNILRDRLDTAADAYKGGLAPKIIMSGDHGRRNYDEVNAMKKYAIEKGIPSGDIFMDHAGFSTYDTMYRAKEIFRAEKAVIISQRYHLYRALYLAEKRGIRCYGIAADHYIYRGQKIRDLREAAARAKDFLAAAISPKPKYLGEAIPVSGDGDITNDR